MRSAPTSIISRAPRAAFRSPNCARSPTRCRSAGRHRDPQGPDRGAEFHRAPALARQSPDASPRIDAALRFLGRPDRRRSFGDWLRILIEDLLVIDAATIYPRFTRVTAERCNDYVCRHQFATAARRLLYELHRGFRVARRSGLNTEEVVHPRGREEFDPQSPHHEYDAQPSLNLQIGEAKRRRNSDLRRSRNRKSVRGTRVQKNLCLRGIFRTSKSSVEG